MTNEAILAGPDVVWNHVDGPLLSWAGQLHWLTPWQRLQLWLGLETLDDVAEKRWPYLAEARRLLREMGHA